MWPAAANSNAPISQQRIFQPSGPDHRLLGHLGLRPYKIFAFNMASESLGVSRSLVWNFFKVSEENDTAKCATCDKQNWRIVETGADESSSVW